MIRTARQDGYVLVATLGVMLVLSGLIASSSLVAHSALRGARIDDAADRLDALLRGGLEMTAYRLFTLKATTSAVDGREIRLGVGSVTPHVTDEGGRIDVNASDPALLAGALRVAGLGREEIAAIIERIAALRGVTLPAKAQPPGAADQPGTTDARPGSQAKPGTASKPDGTEGSGATPDAALATPEATNLQTRTGFRTVGEFLTFSGLGRQDAAALSGLLTVMNPDGKLNVMTAGRRALLALPDMSDVAVDALVAGRRSATTPADLANLKSGLDRQKAYVKFEGGSCYRIRLEARDALHRAASRDAVIANGNSGSDPFYILEWE